MSATALLTWPQVPEQHLLWAAALDRSTAPIAAALARSMPVVDSTEVGPVLGKGALAAPAIPQAPMRWCRKGRVASLDEFPRHSARAMQTFRVLGAAERHAMKMYKRYDEKARPPRPIVVCLSAVDGEDGPATQWRSCPPHAGSRAALHALCRAAGGDDGGERGGRTPRAAGVRLHVAAGQLGRKAEHPQAAPGSPHGTVCLRSVRPAPHAMGTFTDYSAQAGALVGNKY